MLGNDEVTKELLKYIDSCEKYLKARYKTHCKSNDSCKSHCITHALSHPTDNNLSTTCDEVHSSVCRECTSLIDYIATLKLKVSQLPSSHRKEVAHYEIANAEKKNYGLAEAHNERGTTVKSSSKCNEMSRLCKRSLDKRFCAKISSDQGYILFRGHP